MQKHKLAATHFVCFLRDLVPPRPKAGSSKYGPGKLWGLALASKGRAPEGVDGGLLPPRLRAGLTLILWMP